MMYEMASEKTIGKMVALRNENESVREYAELSKQLTDDKKSDSKFLIEMRESGEIATNKKFVNGFATVYFREIEKLTKDKDGNTKLTKAQIEAIAQLCPELIEAVITPAIIDEAISKASGKRTEAAKTIQTINRAKVVAMTYQAVIGEAKQ